MTTPTVRVAFRMTDADRRNLYAVVDLMRLSGGMPLANSSDAIRYALDRVSREAAASKESAV